jgi:hypothetical protein
VCTKKPINKISKLKDSLSFFMKRKQESQRFKESKIMGVGISNGKSILSDLKIFEMSIIIIN